MPAHRERDREPLSTARPDRHPPTDSTDSGTSHLHTQCNIQKALFSTSLAHQCTRIRALGAHNSPLVKPLPHRRQFIRDMRDSEIPKSVFIHGVAGHDSCTILEPLPGYRPDQFVAVIRSLFFYWSSPSFNLLISR